MTTSSIINYYASLLAIQYNNKTKASGTVKTFVTGVIMDQLPVAVQNAFSVDQASGVQLDVLGKYIGISRNQYTFSGPVTLSDTLYRKLMKIKIIQNSFGSSLYEIQTLINTYFADIIFVYDFQDMTMEYFLDTTLGSTELAEVMVKGGFLPRPMAVNLRATIYSGNRGHLFGFRSYDAANTISTPFNSYTSYDTTRKWLSYDDALVP